MCVCELQYNLSPIVLNVKFFTVKRCNHPKRVSVVLGQEVEYFDLK